MTTIAVGSLVCYKYRHSPRANASLPGLIADLVDLIPKHLRLFGTKINPSRISQSMTDLNLNATSVPRLPVLPDELEHYIFEMTADPYP